MSDKKNKKTLIGLVSSDKMSKTVVVEVEGKIKYPIYHKYINRRNKYKAHDENNECNIGDRVLIEECRPLSRDKRWRVSRIIEKAL